MTVADICQEGINRVVPIPADFCPGETKVYINKIGNAVVLIPYHNSWESLFASLPEFSEDFMAERMQPESQIRENIFP